MSDVTVNIDVIDVDLETGSPIVSVETVVVMPTVDVGVPGPQGPPGPPGPPGTPGSVLSYEHSQSSPSDTWIINHNLGFNPHVEVYDTGSQRVTAAILHVSVNQVQVSFSLPTAGFARLI